MKQGRRNFYCELQGHFRERRVGYGQGSAPPLGGRRARAYNQKILYRQPLRLAGGVSDPHDSPHLSEIRDRRDLMDLAEKKQ